MSIAMTINVIATHRSMMAAEVIASEASRKSTSEAFVLRCAAGACLGTGGYCRMDVKLSATGKRLETRLFGHVLHRQAAKIGLIRPEIFSG